jgi:hypothetical protein
MNFIGLSLNGQATFWQVEFYFSISSAGQQFWKDYAREKGSAGKKSS